MAEVSMGAIFGWATAQHLGALEADRAAALARALVWPIVVAQGCCWIGEITDNKLWHVFEESLWGSTFACHAALAAWALVLGPRVAPRPAAEAADAARGYLLALGLFSAPYVWFMFAVDVPMYHGQWLSDEAAGTIYDSPAAGLRRMAVCQEVADDWAGWQEDALWQTLYFCVGPLAARAVARSLRREPICEVPSAGDTGSGAPKM